jgi:hypothetical protein
MTLCELVQEEITDLLCAVPTIGELKIRPCPWRAAKVEGMVEIEVTDAAHFQHLFNIGHARRSICSPAATSGYDAHTGHCVLELTVMKQPSDPLEEPLVAGLTVVDLAGEPQRLSGWLVETPMGNESTAKGTQQSLVFLRNTIGRLGLKGQGADTSQGALPGYRDCKLTRLLTDALGGNSVTALICTLSPALVCSAEAVGTLRVAKQAACIKNKPRRNLVPRGRVVLETRWPRAPRAATPISTATVTPMITSATIAPTLATTTTTTITTSPSKKSSSSKPTKRAGASPSKASNSSSSSSSSRGGGGGESPRKMALQETNLHLLKELEKTHAALAFSMRDREETRQQLDAAMSAIQVQLNTTANHRAPPRCKHAAILTTHVFLTAATGASCYTPSACDRTRG